MEFMYIIYVFRKTDFEFVHYSSVITKPNLYLKKNKYNSFQHPKTADHYLIIYIQKKNHNRQKDHSSFYNMSVFKSETSRSEHKTKMTTKRTQIFDTKLISLKITET